LINFFSRYVNERVAEKRFIEVGLELGGKDPAYVAEDSNIKEAAASLIDGAMYNAGQSCCSIERIYVHQSKYEEFLEEAHKITKSYVLGDPLKEGTTMGPLTLEETPLKLQTQV
jgi:acyl-CoA reductase-like NAD-dependent aldehyde dehydrogenase